MTDGAIDRPVPAAAWDLAVDAGDPVDIFRRPYVFDRVDPDGAVTFRPPAGSAGGDFMVVGADGRPRKPTTGEVLELMSGDDIIWRDRPLCTDARRHARAQQLDAAQAHAMDPVSEFRSAIARRFDANPWSKSDHSLRLFMADALKDPVIAAMPGAWAASPATQRTWYRDRGTEGCRKERDGVSMKNRMRHVRKLAHPLEIVFYHAARATNVRGSVKMNHDNYVAEIAKINAGIQLSRNRYDFDEGCFTERGAEYPVPATPYVTIDYMRFWRLCHELKSEGAYGRKTTKQAAYQRFGGGGLGDLPTHLGAMCWIDSTPVKKAFFVDDVTGIPIGGATLTLMLEHGSKVVPGWDLCIGACNSSSILRTVLRANQVKAEVPDYLLKVDPNLAYLRLRPDLVRFDNSTEAHGRTVEQNLADAYIRTDFVGSKMPRDKNAMERIMGTFQTLLYEHQEDANYDIARMRLYGFDREEGHVLCSIQTGRRLLAIAVMTYNVTRHRGLDNRQPALVWKQRLGTRKLNVLKDVDEFKDGIGVVAVATMSNAGIEKFNRRYTPGALEMRRVFEDFERADRVATGDISPKPKKNRDDRKRTTFKVRIRYDEDDIGILKVWNPHAPSGACWERFGCTDPSAYGMPHWLHQRCLEIADRDAMDYLTPEGQAIVRSRLFEEIANVDSQAAERERQTLGRALADPQVRKVMSAYVEVAAEPAEPQAPIEPEAISPALHGLSTGRRADADIDTPRAKTPPPKEPVTMRRRSRSSEVPAAAAPPTRDPAAPHVRHELKDRKNDRRHAPAPSKSTARSDQQAPPRARSNRLKWGDAF